MDIFGNDMLAEKYLKMQLIQLKSGMIVNKMYLIWCKYIIKSWRNSNDCLGWFVGMDYSC